MANSLAKFDSSPVRHFLSFHFLPMLLLFLFLFHFSSGIAQKTTNGEEKESELDQQQQQHELDEGSGDMFNPDDEDDDLGASGLPPPEETARDHRDESHTHQSQTVPASSIHQLSDTSAESHPQQTFAAAPIPRDGPSFTLSPTTPPAPPISSSIGGTEDEEEGRLRQQFHLALFFSLLVLIVAVGLGSVALCFCCQRRRRTRHNRSDSYAEGREQSRHYL